VPYTIVLADPSPSVQKAAQLVFAEPEFRLSVFEDGASLVEAAAGLRPDALVVSLTLPGRDGYEIGRVLRSQKELAAIPFVGLKGAFESMDSETPPPAEYDEIVLKPFDSERLAAVVRDLIARKTGPPSLPEDPIWLPEEREPGLGAAPAAAPVAAAAGPDLKAAIHEEIVAVEREIEKRVRASLLAELKEWKSKS
jgi:DNA-binding response OmpR family regulator